MTVFWIGLAAIVFYVISLYVYPFRPCTACKGTGRNRGSNRRRYGNCRRCGGTGRRQRIGSRFVHRTVLSFIAERKRARGRRGKERGQLQ